MGIIKYSTRRTLTRAWLISNCFCFLKSVPNLCWLLHNIEKDMKTHYVNSIFNHTGQSCNLVWMQNLKFKFWMQSYVCMAIRQKKNVDLLSGFWRSLEKCLRFFALLLTLKNPHTCCLWGNDFFLFIQFTHLWPCCSPSNRTLKDFCKENVSMSELLCDYCLVGMYTISRNIFLTYKLTL